MMVDEKRFKGTVGWDLYWKYFSSGGGVYFIFSLLLIAVSVGMRIFVDYFLSSWINKEYDLLYKT